MPLYMIHCAFGVFVLDDTDHVILEELTYPSVDSAVSLLQAVTQGTLPPSLKAVLDHLASQDVDLLIVDDRLLARVISPLVSFQVQYVSVSPSAKMFRGVLESHLMTENIIESSEQFRAFIHDVALAIARSTVTSASEKRDLLVKQGVDTIDELDKAINSLFMRLREWYSLHHPSLGKVVDDNETYVRLVMLGGKDNITRENLETIDVSSSQIDKILDALPHDVGAKFESSDMAIIQNLAGRIAELYELRRRVEDYITNLMQLVAPNISSLVRPMVGARLISMAGSLESLAQKPSSTIQVFGAERALFRSLKTGAAPPKHGVIFQVPEIHTAPYWQRGKIARAFASALSIAARIDAFSDRDLSDMLRARLDKRIQEIKQHYPTAPPPKQRSTPTKRKKRPARRKKRGGGRRK